MNTLTCAICDSRKAAICTGCEDVAFCDEGCKAQGERIHSLLCAELERWGFATPRPDEQSYIAIHFPVDGTGPELYWSKKRFQAQINEVTSVVEKIDLLSVDKDAVYSGDFEITCNLATNKELPHSFMFSMRDGRDIDGSTVNLSILELTRGDQRGLWAGPAVLYREQEHISLSDLTCLATFLKTCRDKGSSLKHALRVGELKHVELTRPELFNEVKEMVRAKKEARDMAAALEASYTAAWESGYGRFNDEDEDEKMTGRVVS